MIAPEAGLSISRQCTLLGIARSSFYYRPRPESAEELELLKRLDRIFTDMRIPGEVARESAMMSSVAFSMMVVASFIDRPECEPPPAATRAVSWAR